MIVAEEVIPLHAETAHDSRLMRQARSIRRLRDRLSVARVELQGELKVVGDIQRSLLPERLPDIPGFDIAPYYQPSALAGGDYYDIVPLVDDHWGLVMADVAGHGASAAVIMAVMRALVHAHLPRTRYLPSCEFLEFMNRQMTGVYTSDGRFVTLWCAVLDPASRRLTYGSAGHPPPRLVRGGSVSVLNGVGGLPLGIDETARYQERCVQLEPGDRVAIYTDGITEAMRFVDGAPEQFQTERLDRVLLESRRDTAAGCVARVAAAVRDFSGASVPADDQTMMAIRVE